MLRALESASDDIIYETGGTLCYGHWVLRSRDIVYETVATICYRHWVLRLMISHTRQGLRFVTGIGCCVL